MPNQNEPNVTGFIPFDAELISATEKSNRAKETMEEYARKNALLVFELGADSLRKGTWPAELSELMYDYANLKTKYLDSVAKLHSLMAEKLRSASATPPDSLPGTLHDYLNDK